MKSTAETGSQQGQKFDRETRAPGGTDVWGGRSQMSCHMVGFLPLPCSRVAEKLEIINKMDPSSYSSQLSKKGRRCNVYLYAAPWGPKWFFLMAEECSSSQLLGLSAERFEDLVPSGLREIITIGAAGSIFKDC